MTLENNLTREENFPETQLVQKEHFDDSGIFTKQTITGETNGVNIELTRRLKPGLNVRGFSPFSDGEDSDDFLYAGTINEEDLSESDAKLEWEKYKNIIEKEKNGN